MKHLGDISTINGSQIEPVDIITFGSPCQDLSVAGKRAGIKDGDRSNLFFQAIRIIKEMRCSTNGEYPKYVIWENVPGAFSSSKGYDFLEVLKAFVETADKSQDDVPEPKGKNGRLTWTKAGCIVGGGFSIAWRTLDAQYWGVPQRRARIYLVADFAGGSAGKILFESEGMSGYTPQGFRPWQGVAGAFAEGAGASGCVCLNDQGGSRMDVTEDVAATLRAEAHHPPCVMDAAGFCTEHSSQSRSIGYEEECSPCARADSSPCVDRGQNVVCVDCRNHRKQNISGTLQAKENGGQSLNYISPVVYSIQGNCIDRADTAMCNGCGWREKATHTLNTIDRHAVAYSIGNGQPNQISMQDVCNTPDCMHDQQAILCDAHPSSERRKYIVRRLTPLECCRLQGFPDGWDEIPDKQHFTDEEAAFWNGVRSAYARINGKAYKPAKRGSLLRWYNKLGADSAKYKMWGNGIALPCAEFVLCRVANELRHNG